LSFSVLSFSFLVFTPSLCCFALPWLLLSKTLLFQFVPFSYSRHPFSCLLVILFFGVLGRKQCSRAKAK
jgi:1,4-dihydroxy-2-naphthoate octaprenyltransferase